MPSHSNICADDANQTQTAKSTSTPAVMEVTQAAATQPGFYCSTSGTYFDHKDSLVEHYRSDFHKYNLKRKLAGLPPVTKEWFDARKAQLTTAGPTVQKIWLDPLTGKKYFSENTYLAATRSKKYQELVRKSGQSAPKPVVSVRKAQPPAASPAAAAGDSQAGRSQASSRGFTVIVPNGVDHNVTSHIRQKVAELGRENMQVQQAKQLAEEGRAEAALESDAEDDTSSGGWETASDNEVLGLPDAASDMATAGSSTTTADQLKQLAGPVDGEEAGEKWEEWDVRRSLFDNHMSASLEENMEYMYKKFGFYFPDADELKDPKGLLRYLGAKLRYGHVPLYERGDDESAKQLGSLHAVQRHMVDSGRTKLAWEGNEDEYADFYDWADDEEAAAAGAAGTQLALPDQANAAAVPATGGFELVLASSEGGGTGGKLLGSREFRTYYRQRHRAVDGRASVAANAVAARYRALGIASMATPVDKQKKATDRLAKKMDRIQLRNALKANIIRDLPKNVTF